MISGRYKGGKMSDYNIYCDESCHLEKDHQKVMVLGAIWCPVLKTKEILDELRDVKIKHGLSNNFELKWTKISPAKIDYYLEVASADGIFDNPAEKGWLFFVLDKLPGYRITQEK